MKGKSGFCVYLLHARIAHGTGRISGCPWSSFRFGTLAGGCRIKQWPCQATRFTIRQSCPLLPLPLFVWGNGACRDNGLQHGNYLRQIASQGYFVIALGRPRAERQPDPPSPPAATACTCASASPLLARRLMKPRRHSCTEAIDWATAENARNGSPFNGHIDVEHVAVGGHSCGGLQALAVSGDPRIDTTLVINSGIYVTPGRSGIRVGKDALKSLHGPALYLAGGPDDIAFPNASDDVARINHVPVFFGSLPVGHGGTFWSQPDGGEWARVSTRWLDWQLKGNDDASWDFAGPQCRLCTDARWTVVQKQLGLPKGPFRESRYVAVRDGTRLAMNIYRPAIDGRPVTTPHPVVFSFTPYRARYHDAAGKLVELGQFTGYGLKDLTERGYVLAVADIRGKGASFGSRRGFQDRTEANDGYDLVQWLAAQPWGSDKVGMVGCSYLGGTTVHVASTAPPALKAIFTGATDLDKYAFVRRGGITAQFNTRPDEPLSDDLMSLPMDADPEGSQLRTAVAEHARNTPMAALWYGMPYRDSVSKLTGNRFWEEAGPYPYIDAIRKAGIATYFWGNWQDEPTEQVILLYANLGGKLLVGPGSHCVPPPGYDLGGEIRRYLDHHLKGVDTGLYREPKVTYFVNGAAKVTSGYIANEVPGAGVARTPYYLGSSARLTRSAPGSSSDSFAVDYSVASTSTLHSGWSRNRRTDFTYTGPALESDSTLVGYPISRLVGNGGSQRRQLLCLPGRRGARRQVHGRIPGKTGGIAAAAVTWRPTKPSDCPGTPGLAGGKPAAAGRQAGGTEVRADSQCLGVQGRTPDARGHHRGGSPAAQPDADSPGSAAETDRAFRAGTQLPGSRFRSCARARPPDDLTCNGSAVTILLTIW